jgi:hypothetical protein
MRQPGKQWKSVAVLGASILCVVLASTPASAVQSAGPLKTVVRGVHTKLSMCSRFNNVRYWRHPGRDPLGQIHRGQKMEWQAGTIVDGKYWAKVDLWGGPSGVWVLRDNIDNC